MIWNWFGTENKLRRAVGAIEQGRLMKARGLLGEAWHRLVGKRQSGRSDAKLEEEVLAALWLVETRSNQTAAAIKWCRQAQSLGLQRALFFDYPCRLHLAATGPLTDDCANDLVSWACHQNAKVGNDLTIQVGNRLSEALLPSTHKANRQVVKSLDRLVGTCRLWNWPYIYRAEFARYEQDWPRAGVLLHEAAKLTSNGHEKATMLWESAHCLYVSNEFKAARELGGAAASLSLPLIANHWRLWVRLATNEPEAFERITRGLTAYSDDRELLTQLWRFAVATARWSEIMAVFERVYSQAKTVRQKIRALELWCAAAVWARDGPQATFLAELISRRVAIPGSPTESAPHSDRTAARRQQTVPLESTLVGLPGWLFVFASICMEGDKRLLFARTVVKQRVLEQGPLDMIHLAVVSSQSASPAPLKTSDEVVLWFATKSSNDHRFGPQWSRLALNVALRIAGEHPVSTFEILRRCSPVMAVDPHFLHTLALAAANNLQRSSDCRSSATDEALVSLIGSWTAFLANDDALRNFANRRYLAYRVKKTAPKTEDIGAIAHRQFCERLERRPSADERHATRVRLLCDVEKEAVTRVASFRGIPLDETETVLMAGPLLSFSLGIEETVSGWLKQVTARPWTTNDTDLRLRLLASMLGIDVEGGGQPPSNDEQQRELIRLFSPLAFAAVRLAQGQYQDAERLLNGDASQSTLAGELPPALECFEATHDPDWLTAERRGMRLECHLEHSKELVARVPIDLVSVEGKWNKAVAAGKAISMEADAKRLIGEIAVGRAKVLFHKRMKHERLNDHVDSRSTSERRIEALALLEMAWKITEDDRVQGSLTECLNGQAVALANKHRFEEAARLIIRLLRIKPNARTSAENLFQIVMAHADRSLGGDTDAAGQFLLSQIREIRTLDPMRAHTEIQRCVEQLAEHGSTPFFNGSQEAAEKKRWDEATGKMIWALRLSPSDPVVGAGTFNLASLLNEQVALGNQDCARWLQTLMQAVPDEIRKRLLVAEQLMAALRNRIR